MNHFWNMQKALIIVVSSDQILEHMDSKLGPERTCVCPGHKQKGLISPSLYKDVIAVYESDMY